jgi:alpha-mannosidase
MSVAAWHVPGEPVSFGQLPLRDFEPFRLGSPWGSPWSTVWFHVTGLVPPEWANRDVEAIIDLSFDQSLSGFQAEGLVYTRDGSVIKGLAPRNHHVPVSPSLRQGVFADFYIEAAANPTIVGASLPTLLGDVETADKRPLYRLARADLAVLDREIFDLLTDIRVLRELVGELSDVDPRRHQIVQAFDTMLRRLDLRDVAASAAAARDALARVLSQRADASAHRVSAVGHAHIDSAWLWPVRETVRKCARTFSNVVSLMEHYPEFVFACSQAQQYAWVQRDYPALYGRIKDKVASGQWQPVGGMWVEADGNLPGGEALVRQFSLGKRFFLQEFGVDCEEVWLPDSFGYSAAYPQIAALAGFRWFLTQKLSWNETNRMPHHTFWWEGIDGTRIFTHFPPVDTYNAQLTASELARASAYHADKARSNRSLVPFGFGDGGGGPTRDMLEVARRLADLEASPRVAIERPSDFFTMAEREYPDAEVWVGELYLEAHRGTYTSQAEMKRWNRTIESRLHEAELWSTASTVVGEARYPAAKLEAIWRTALLHQFHDILPGSSVAWVYREAEAAYREIGKELDEVIGLAVPEPTGAVAHIANADPHVRSEVVVDSAALPLAGAQQLRGGRAAFWAAVPGLGVASIRAQLPSDVQPVCADDWTLANGIVHVKLDAAGLIESLVHLPSGREIIPPGERANLLQLHEDLPAAWDAWNIDASAFDDVTDVDGLESMELVESGDHLAAIEIVRRFGDSQVTQTISLRAGGHGVDIETVVDWHEYERLLKLAFPVDVHALYSSAEIQFGHIRRPTHANTSWEKAKFEIVAHRWLHVEEPGFGVALANDATYGHDVRTSPRLGGGSFTVVRASLLRGARYPDPEADQGRHRFRHALVPGTGISGAIAAGYAINYPLRLTGAALRDPLFEVDDPRVLVETVKMAEDASGDLVVRVYESSGARVSTRLRWSFDARDVIVVDLLERALDTIEASLRGARVDLHPFQILSLRMRLTDHPVRDADIDTHLGVGSTGTVAYQKLFGPRVPSTEVRP